VECWSTASRACGVTGVPSSVWCRRRTEWVPLRKSVAYLFRYRDVAQQSNARYLNALAQVDDPTPGLRGPDTITTRKHPAQGRSLKAFNPVARPDYPLFVALMSGEHAVHGFADRDLRAKLTGQLRHDSKQQSPRSADSSTASTSTGSSRRSPARAAGASPRLATASWALRFDSASCISPPSTPRPRRREEPREFHRKKQRTNDGRIYARRRT